MRATDVPWTIVRPSAINFVSVRDVAHFEPAVTDPAMRGVAVDIGGENVTFKEFFQTIRRESGKQGTARHIARPMMRVASVLMQPLNPVLARQIHAGVVMDTFDMTSTAEDRVRRYPAIPVTPLVDVVRMSLTR